MSSGLESERSAVRVPRQSADCLLRVALPAQGKPHAAPRASLWRSADAPRRPRQFTTKQLQKQSRKAAKDETAEKAKLKKVRIRCSRARAAPPR